MTDNYSYRLFSQDFPLPSDFDIRESIHNTIHGSSNESAKGRWVVLQKLRRDNKNEPIKSPYTYQLSEEGQAQNNQPNTTRTGYLCDEYWIRVIMIPSGRLALDEMQATVGMLETKRMVFLVSALEQHIPQEHDVFILPTIDPNGNIVSPVTIDQIFNITIPYIKILDNGRPEYYAFVAEKQF